jgi:hypothetical protein
LYGYSFGSDGEVVNVWSEDQFQDTLLAIHAYNKLQSELAKAQEITRERLRQNGKIALHVAARHAGGRAAVRSGPDRKPGRSTATGLWLVVPM